MVMLLLSLMVILASVEGSNKPFTAFQEWTVDGSKPTVGVRKVQPDFQRVPRKVSNFQQPASKVAKVQQPAKKISNIQQPAIRVYNFQQTTKKVSNFQQPAIKVSNFQQPAIKVSNFQENTKKASNSLGNNVFDFKQTTRKVSNIQQPALYEFISAFRPFFTGNVVEQTRAQADSTKAVLRSLASNPTAAKYIERVIEISKCLDTIEDAIDGIEGAAKLVEKNGPEILKLVETAESLENEKDIKKLVKGAANMLRILDDLIPNLLFSSSKQCNASPADTIEAFKELAGLVEDISNSPDLQLSYSTRQQLALSSKILSEVTSFLGKINKSLSSFGELCNKDKDYNINVINAIGDIMESMAVLFDNLGSGDRAKEIENKGEFVKKAVEAFSDLDIDSTLECGSVGSLRALAQTLDDMMMVVEDIGIEKLSSELGIDLEFINSF